MDVKTHREIVAVLRQQGRGDLALAFDPGRVKADRAMRRLQDALKQVTTLMQGVPEAKRYLAKLQKEADRFEFFVQTLDRG